MEQRELTAAGDYGETVRDTQDVEARGAKGLHNCWCELGKVGGEVGGCFEGTDRRWRS